MRIAVLQEGEFLSPIMTASFDVNALGQRGVILVAGRPTDVAPTCSAEAFGLASRVDFEACTEQVEASATVHVPLDHLELYEVLT
jgi:hypothetical protein